MVSPVIAVIALLALACTASAANVTSRQVNFDIKAQPLASALIEFSKQTQLQVMSHGVDLTQRQTAGVVGRRTIAQALSQLLTNTNLGYTATAPNTIAIITADSNAASVTGADSGKAHALRLVQAQSSPAPASSQLGARENDRAALPEEKAPSRLALEEIVVTGTHIRGGGNASSPVTTLDRLTIARSGYATTEQLMQSLPQNLSTFSDTTFGGVNGGADGSYGQGSGINLRGLGGDSTLVLLNGRRLASAAQGHYVDVSLIPLSAIERVEVLTDGASAIYGSDAVGGVVNIILREQFDGAESRARYGTVTQGASSELQLGQSFGTSWESGNLMLSYDYFRRTALDAADRDFVNLGEAGLLEHLKLVPGQKRHGLLLTGSQQLSERVKLTADALFGRRDSDLTYQIIGLPPIPIDSQARQSSASLGASVDLGADWQLRATGSFGRNETRQESASPVLNSLNEFRTQIGSAEVAADGPVASLPGGDVRLAVGSLLRKEKLRDDAAGTVLNPLVTIDRDVVAAYGELLVPLAGAANRSRGLERLELSLAARFEDYSDFGSTTNPKVGVSYSPVRGLNLRATYGKSFKAPLLSELNPESFRPFAYELIDPSSPTGFTPTLVLQGSSLNLGPERARTWTAGIEVAPDALPGFKLEVTYFDIDFEDRIAPPLPFDERLFSILLDPTVQAFIDRTPDAAEVAALLSRPNFANVTGAPLTAADIGAIADSRLINIADSVTRGLDFALAYQAKTRLGAWSVQLLSNYLFNDEQQILPTAPAIDFLNTVHHQPDFRARGGVSFARGTLTTSAFVNYIDGYRDTRSAAEAGPNQRATVDSWTTVDASLIWAPAPGAGGLLENLTITLSALNVFDRDPPYIASALGLYFDGVNATPLGRWVSLHATKQW